MYKKLESRDLCFFFKKNRQMLVDLVVMTVSGIKTGTSFKLIQCPLAHQPFNITTESVTICPSYTNIFVSNHSLEQKFP
jgi:hypothetical protein